MDDARAKLKDLGERIDACMAKHGITMAEICIRRFRWRVHGRLIDLTGRYRELSHALDSACYSAREMSEGLMRLKRGRHG